MFLSLAELKRAMTPEERKRWNAFKVEWMQSVSSYNEAARRNDLPAMQVAYDRLKNCGADLVAIREACESR